METNDKHAKNKGTDKKAKNKQNLTRDEHG